METMTLQQYMDYRTNRGQVSVGSHFNSTPIKYECDLHNAIIDYCKSKGWQYLHGSMAHRTRRVCGEPDFIVLAHGSQLRMIEVKTKTGKLTLEQQGFIAHAAKNGHVVYVVRSMEEFEKLFC
jgi:hypothetical protein